MKTLILAIIINAAFIPITSVGQDMTRQVPCNNELILHQADSIKKILTQNGFILLKEESVTMESEYEVPVIVPLTGGSWYQFVFIGEISSKLYEVRMYDWNERQVVYEKNKLGDLDANIVSCSYIPSSSEYHMIRAVQVNKKKKKDLCGYVMLLKKANTKP